MYELLYLVLHAPVAELYTAQLVSSHDGLVRVIPAFDCLPILLTPVVIQWAPLGCLGDVYFRVFFLPVVTGGDGVLDNVQVV